MPMTGQPIFMAKSMTLTIFSPKTSPSEPPKTVKSWANTRDLAAVDRAVAGDHAVAVRAVAAPGRSWWSGAGRTRPARRTSPRRAAARCARGRSSCPGRAASRRPAPTRRGPPRRRGAGGRRACRRWCAGRAAGPRRRCRWWEHASAMAGSLALSLCANPWTSRPCARRCSRPARPWRSVDGHATRRLHERCEAALAAGAVARRGRRPPERRPRAARRGTGRRRPGASVAVSVVVPCPAPDRGWLPLLTGLAWPGALQRGGRGAGAAEVAERRARRRGRRPQGLRRALRDGRTARTGGPVAPAAWSSPARASTSTSAARSCRWTPRRPCGCAGSPSVRREDLLLAFLDGFAELHAAWAAGATAMHGAPRGSTARLCVTIGRPVRVQPAGPPAWSGRGGRRRRRAGWCVDGAATGGRPARPVTSSTSGRRPEGAVP